ncbi:MAG: tRNA lysidine(34) synthetase TilS [Paramuribaculum sp.]|nr:tRNA lysidine(34) synthetase TilS [Paramuribaculum sp.]
MMSNDYKATEMVEAGIRSLLGEAGEAGHIVVGLSGGADSVALTVAMRRIGYDMEALHCNYHLRGDESDSDEAYVRRLCGELGIPLTVCGLDVEAEALQGESVEMTCRRLRYALFAERARATGAWAVAVAHHRDDNVETFFLNLMRSAGIAGLKGMLPVAPLPGDPSVRLVRPLLGVTRDMTERYLGEQGVEYVVDSTNLGCDYTRNRVRNRVMPALRADFPGADAAVAASIDHLREAYGFVVEMTGRLERIYCKDGAIDVAAMMSDVTSARFVLLSLLSGRGFSAEQVDEIVCCVGSRQARRRFVGGRNEYLLDRGVLRPVAGEDSIGEYKVTVERVDAAGLVMERSNYVAYFDADEWDAGQAVEWRPWRQGDMISPLGMRGRKKLSDVFNDAKTPADVKAVLPLAVKDGEVLWVPGVKRSRLLTVGPSTRSVVVCRLCRPAR